MKNEYLNRTVTINPKSLACAVADVAREKAETPDDPLAGLSFVVAGGAVGAALAVEVFGGSEETIHIRGEDFAVKAYETLRKAFESYGENTETREDHFAAADCLWGTMTLLTAVEDKLFGSDHVKEETNE